MICLTYTTIMTCFFFQIQWRVTIFTDAKTSRLDLICLQCLHVPTLVILWLEIGPHFLHIDFQAHPQTWTLKSFKAYEYKLKFELVKVWTCTWKYTQYNKKPKPHNLNRCIWSSNYFTLALQTYKVLSYAWLPQSACYSKFKIVKDPPFECSQTRLYLQFGLWGANGMHGL